MLGLARLLSLKAVKAGGSCCKLLIHSANACGACKASIKSVGCAPLPVRGGAARQLVGLITRRSQVRILPPLPKIQKKIPAPLGFFLPVIFPGQGSKLRQAGNRFDSVAAGAERGAFRATQSCPANFHRYTFEFVVPAQAGTHASEFCRRWIPACAGMTEFQ